jgi:hypothetical protein
MMLTVALLLTVTAAVNLSPQTTEAAGTLSVTNGNDSGNGSLRAAIASAQNGNTIVFSASVTKVTLTSGEISFGQADITINGGSGVIIERAGTPSFRLLNSTATTGTLTLKGLTIQNGKTDSGTANSGGGVHTNGALAAENCTFTGNTTGSTGGAVYSGATASMTNCTFTGNTSTNAGGGLYVNNGDTVLTGCVFSNNTSSSAGGGLYSNSNVILTDCEFKNNTATGGNGGGVRSFGNVTASNCTFTGNVTRGSSNGSGGGIWANNNVILNGCVFADNTARIRGSGVSASNAALMILTNCTFINNKPYTTNPADIGTIDCAAKTYIFHNTIANNLGGGIFADGGKAAYLHNSIVIGNNNAAGTAPLQTVSGSVNYINSLVEGSVVSGNAVTNRQVFGMNSFDAAEGTLSVLINGIATGGAQALSTSDLVGYAGLSSTDRAAIDASVAALSKDQAGADRLTSGSVTYGAVENGLNSLIGVSVGTDPAKITYIAGETINLAGTLLDLEYTNGTDSGIPYTEPGVTNTSGTVNMNTIGPKQIGFAFLGVTTATNLEITVTDTAVITLSSDRSSTVLGEEVTFVALIQPGHAGSGLPTGTVTFYDGSTSIGDAALSVIGTGYITVSDLSVGSHSVTAVYNDDDYYYGLSSSALLHTVNKADTSIVITSVTLDIGGGTVAFEAHLSVVPPGNGDNALNGRNVIFIVDGYELESTPCDSFGDVSLTQNILDLISMGMSLPGNHVIKAVFKEDGDLNGCESTEMNHDVDKSDTVLNIIVAPPSISVYGQEVTVTATLSVVGLVAGLPVDLSGMEVMLYDNGAPMSGSPFICNSAGEISALFVPPSFGSHILTAEFAGDDLLGINACTRTIGHVVLPASVNVSLNMPPSSVYGQNVTIAVSVSVVSPGGADLTGMEIIFRSDMNIIGTGTLDSSGTATIETDALPTGTHRILAIFSGNNYLRSETDFDYLAIDRDETGIDLSIIPNASVYGDNITLTATVTVETPGTEAPTGSVVFYDGANVLGTGTLSDGIATFSTASLASPLSAGSHMISAVYLGDVNYLGKETPAEEHVVSKKATAASLSSVPASSATGQEVNFIAEITSQAGRPTGSVEFYNKDLALIGTGTLDADGRAAFSTNSLPLGTHTITVNYLGDSNFGISEASCDHIVKEAIKEDGGKTYYITATADGGSTITPSGNSTVQRGENRTFYFSAADGYSISSVAVNGVRLAKEQTDLGYYTFRNVIMNNTIDVKSVLGSADITLRIDVVEGSGHAEYSVNGSSFITYTSVVSLPYDADLTVRAVADDGNIFTSWDTPTKKTASEISFSDVEMPMHLNLHFKDDSSDSDLLWLIIGLLILLLIVIFILFFILWRRRKKDEEATS